MGTIIMVKVTANKTNGLCIFASRRSAGTISLSIASFLPQHLPAITSIRKTVLFLLGYIFSLLNGNSAG
jgi:hypothetical protein